MVCAEGNDRSTSHAPQLSINPLASAEQYQRGRGRCTAHLIAVFRQSLAHTKTMSEAPRRKEESQTISASSGVITLGSSE